MALRDDQVLFQRVEVAQQEIAGEEVAHLAEIIIEADHVDPFIRLELIGLLCQERELDAVTQVRLADTPNRNNQAIPLLGIQDAIAEKFEILQGEFMAQECGLALETGNKQCGLSRSQLMLGNDRSLICLADGQCEVIFFILSLVVILMYVQVETNYPRPRR